MTDQHSAYRRAIAGTRRLLLLTALAWGGLTPRAAYATGSEAHCPNGSPAWRRGWAG